MNIMDAGKKFLSEFIDCYEVCRSLWDSSSTEYTSRHTKLFAYNQLLRVMRKYKKDASITDVKKKINTLRSNFRREMNKISLSEARGDNPLYTPNLWWFEKFNFLRNLKNPKHHHNSNNTTNITSAKHEEVFLDEYLLDDDEEQQEEEEEDPVYNSDVKYEENKSKRHLLEETYIQPMPMPMPMPKKIKIQENRDRDDSMLIKYNVLPTTSSSSSSSTDGDTFDHMCKAWAGNLREMDKTQRIIAGRAISEIIFQGQIGALTYDSIPKMSTNASFSSPQQMVSNNTRVPSGGDPIAYTSNKSQDLDYRQSSGTQSRRDSSPKPITTFSSVTSSNNQHIIHGPSSTSSQPQKPEYSSTSSSMEQQSFSTIQQSGQFFNQ